MEQKRPEVDFLDEKDKVIKQPRKKFSPFGKIATYVLVGLLLLGVVFSIGVITSGESLSRTFARVGLWGQVQNLISSDDKQLRGEEDGRINILLLGIGGGDHDGPLLTDTIMMASYDVEKEEAALISLPRDLLVSIPGYGNRKINHAYAYGEVYEDGSGADLAREVVSDVLGLDIHYYVRIDFDGFVQLVDDMGGITVHVENTLDDPRYPVKGMETATTSLRYEHLYVEAGEQEMDGSLALKFVRSRQGLNGEGSDFARSERQQNVLLGIKNRALSFGFLANPLRVNNLFSTLGNHVETDFEIWEVIRMFQLSKDIDQSTIGHTVFDDSPNGPLYSRILDTGAFVLLPNAGDFSDLQYVAEHIFDKAALEARTPQRVAVLNGTRINGLASTISRRLENQGYEVVTTSNAPTQDYVKSVLYLSNQTDHGATIAQDIANYLEISQAESLPEWVTSTTTPAVSGNPDIVIVLGEDLSL